MIINYNCTAYSIFYTRYISSIVDTLINNNIGLNSEVCG